MSQMVQVVSMLEVPKRLGSVSFQSKEVRGAQYSEFLRSTQTLGHSSSHLSQSVSGSSTLNSVDTQSARPSRLVHVLDVGFG